MQKLKIFFRHLWESTEIIRVCLLLIVGLPILAIWLVAIFIIYVVPSLIKSLTKKLIERISVFVHRLYPKVHRLYYPPSVSLGAAFVSIAHADEWKLNLVQTNADIEYILGVRISPDEADEICRCFLKRDDVELRRILKEKTNNQMDDVQRINIEKRIQSMLLILDEHNAQESWLTQRAPDWWDSFREKGVH